MERMDLAVLQSCNSLLMRFRAILKDAEWDPNVRELLGGEQEEERGEREKKKRKFKCHRERANEITRIRTKDFRTENATPERCQLLS